MWVLEVKQKVISEYNKMKSYMQIGKTYDYEHILDMINFIEIAEYTNNEEVIAKHFVNK